MISKISLTAFGFLFLHSLIQAAPIEPIKEVIPTPKKTPLESIITSQSSAASASSDAKKKLNKRSNVEAIIPFDEFTDDDSSEERDIEIKHKLHPKMKETTEKIHDNVQQPLDNDDFDGFTEMKMKPSELTNLADQRRRRRHVSSNDQANQRHKRALSSYELYDVDPLYASALEQYQFVRPTRSFSPIYWYPSSYERSIRSALASSLFDRPEWSRIIVDDIDENEDMFLNNDDEYERYPIPFDASDNPYDSFDLTQEYNMDDDDDDDNGSNDYNDEEIYPV
ncbi:unnamed protein product [Adineta ricciae]|uniref:Uncharacterized protein n=1 Tax=Adineta ricciae TaxID=249248 RepID=A0A815GPH1_ADIRI|nr:unnamed protein product [Adineta ricciae]